MTFPQPRSKSLSSARSGPNPPAEKHHYVQGSRLTGCAPRNGLVRLDAGVAPLRCDNGPGTGGVLLGEGGWPLKKKKP